MAHPKWIDRYAEASYQLIGGNVLEAFALIDFYHFYPLWYDLWLDKIFQGISEFKKRGLSIREHPNIFPPPSSVRAILLKYVSAFSVFPKTYDQEKFKTIINFLIEVLKNQCHKDIFCQKGNFCHKEDELKNLFKEISWRTPERAAAQNLGRLYMALGNLINGLYNDLVTDMGWEVYGPYDVTKIFSRRATLLIKDFPNLKPIELWPEISGFNYRKITLYTIYQEIECKIGYVGCHIVTSSNLAENLLKYAVVVDGKVKNQPKEILKLKEYFLNLASKHFLRVKKLNFEELKQKVLLQECYQLHEFFDFLLMPWQPTEEMKKAVKNRPLLSGEYPRGRIISYKEYCQYFGVNKLKEIFS